MEKGDHFPKINLAQISTFDWRFKCFVGFSITTNKSTPLFCSRLPSRTVSLDKRKGTFFFSKNIICIFLNQDAVPIVIDLIFIYFAKHLLKQKSLVKVAKPSIYPAMCERQRKMEEYSSQF